MPLILSVDCSSSCLHFAKNLPAGWQHITAWRTAELPAHATPVLPRYAAAIAGIFATHHPTLSLAILLGFHCFLRTGELLAL
eukprot:8447785-Prorocentrum_lima.AAC.1